jgi:hypothetical protein
MRGESLKLREKGRDEPGPLAGTRYAKHAAILPCWIDGYKFLSDLNHKSKRTFTESVTERASATIKIRQRMSQAADRGVQRSKEIIFTN